MTTLDLEKLHLDEGAHAKPEDGMCVMEAVAFVAGEPFSDHPECASPILGQFLRSWNDALPDSDRQMLKPYIPRLIGTNTGAADEEARAWMLTDWLARECAPAFLAAHAAAASFRAVSSIGCASVAASLDRIGASPSSTAAWSVSPARKGGDYDAQYAAAKAAAEPLIQEKFGETAQGLQASALLLLDRMIDVSQKTAAA